MLYIAVGCDIDSMGILTAVPITVSGSRSPKYVVPKSRTFTGGSCNERREGRWTKSTNLEMKEDQDQGGPKCPLYPHEGVL